MGLGTPEHQPDRPTRYEWIRVPVSQFELRDIRTGIARPTTISFQAQYLPQFLEMVEGES
jgi:hypothetical protein